MKTRETQSGSEVNSEGADWIRDSESSKEAGWIRDPDSLRCRVQ